MSKQANRQIVFEVDGDRWTATVVDVGKKSYSVVACYRCDGEATTESMTDGGGDEGPVPPQLLAWLEGNGYLDLPAHVVASDRGVARFELPLPSMKREELVACFKREGRRICSLDPAVPVLVGWKTGSRKEGRTAYSVLVTARDGLVQSLQDQPAFQLASLMDRGEAILAALPQDAPERLIVVDANSQDIRFVYLESGVTKKERRIHAHASVGLGEAGTESLESVLSLELPRTLDYLADLGLESPEAVAFPPSLGLDRVAMEGLASGLGVFDLKADSGALAQGADGPGVGTMGALKHLVGDVKLTTLSFGVVRKQGPQLRIAAALTMLISLSGVVGGFHFQGSLERMREEVRVLEEEIAQTPLTEDLVVDTEQQSEIGRIAIHLQERRPASLFVSEVCNRVPEGLHLESLSYDVDDNVVIEGFVVGITNLDAIRRLGRFQTELERLPYLENLKEKVGYGTDSHQGIVVTFKIKGRWAH